MRARAAVRGMISLIIVAVLAPAGCIRIPQPTGYSYSRQHKMQSAHHWNVLAADVAKEINNELIARGYLVTPVYVRHSCGKPDNCGKGETYAFDEGFNDLLVTKLVNFGVPTRAKEEESALTVEYKVQVVFHPSPPRQLLQPGVLTALSAGILVLRNAPEDLLILASSGAVDMAAAATVINGHYEVIITTSIVDDNKYVMRSSSIYYINDMDFWHYQQTVPAKELELSNS
ncbi:MAG: hypothetical protein CSA32_02505 [Desulfobulbus propionicus]|nr:MAG: hypothetical protein CSA32_02505 [Desulfobulbus propionicus]